jgi:hypothetical protein
LWVPVVAAPHLTRYGFAGNRKAMSGVRLMDWARILAFVTGTVDQELLARIEYLAAENRILKAQLKVLCVPKTLSVLIS